MTSATPESSSRLPRSTSPWLPVIPMAVRWAPGMGCGRIAQLLNMFADGLNFFGVACAFMTTNMGDPSALSLLAVYREMEGRAMFEAGAWTVNSGQ